MSTDARRTLLPLIASWLLTGCIERGDAMPPMVAIIEPRSGITSFSENLRITGCALDDDGIAAIRIDGADFLSSPGYEGERGRRLIEFRITVNNVTDGEVAVAIEAEDVAGRTTTLPYRLRLDSTAPTIELTSVTSIGDDRLRVVGVARDNSLLTSIAIAGVPLAFSPAAEHTFRVDVAASGGGEIVVEDAAGNTTRRSLR